MFRQVPKVLKMPITISEQTLANHTDNCSYARRYS